VSIGLEWIITTILGLTIALLGVFWRTYEKHRDEQKERTAKDVGDVENRLDSKIKDIEERLTDAIEELKNSFRDASKENTDTANRSLIEIWSHIHDLGKHVAAIDKVCVSMTTEIENIQRRINEIPTEKVFYQMFREFEDRIEKRIVKALEKT
jgi:GTP1/Obg family GTP-binding protein